MLEGISSSLPDISSLLSGIYALQQWSIAGAVYLPPQVEGRFVLGDGAIIAILHNRVDAAAHSSATLFGRYRLDASTFAYGYDVASTSTHTPSGIACSEQVPWQGMREFTVSASTDSIHIVSLAGSEEFIFSRDGFTYAEQGVVLRRWARVTSGAVNSR